MTGLFVVTLMLAAQAWSNYALAGRIVLLTRTDHALFDALISVRAQIPKDSTALIATDDPRPVIEATHREAERAVLAALAALQASDTVDRDAHAAAIRHAWQQVETLQPTVAAQASAPRSERKLQAVDPWREAIHGTTDALNMASIVVGNTVRIGDPLIAEMVQIRRNAWTIRDRYGLQCSLLRANVDASLPLSAAQLGVWSANRAVYSAAWHNLDEYLLRPGVADSLRERIASARGETERAQARVDAIVGRLDGSGKPAVASAVWTSLCDGPFASILAIAQQAQDEANRHAESIRVVSFRMLLVAALDLTAVIGFGAFAVINVQRRLARPMKLLLGAIARLGRRDYHEPVPAGGPDELGSMARALESLRTGALEAERLQQAMNRFTADASHQMRTPLSILRTHISVLDTLIPPHGEAHSSLEDIRQAAERLQRLLIQLLNLARADGRPALDRETQTVDLRELLQEIASKHAPRALQAGIELHFEAPQRRYPRRANPVVLNEIFSNLIDNAILYNEAGGSVYIRLFEIDDQQAVDVEDDGPGIPEAERENVFTRFYRLSRDQSRVGSGLGLAIVRSLAATLNARIVMMAGRDGRGLCVRVSFD